MNLLIIQIWRPLDRDWIDFRVFSDQAEAFEWFQKNVENGHSIRWGK
jgi:hypothetical protein